MKLLNIILTLILVLVIIWFFKSNGLTKIAQDNAQYNAHACAVEGMMPNCRTPLPTK